MASAIDLYTLKLAATSEAEPLHQEEIDAMDEDIPAMFAEDAIRLLGDTLSWRSATLANQRGDIGWRQFRDSMMGHRAPSAHLPPFG